MSNLDPSAAGVNRPAPYLVDGGQDGPKWILAAGPHEGCVVRAVEEAGERCCLLCDAPGIAGIVFSRLSGGFFIGTRACLAHVVHARPEIARAALDAISFATTPAPGVPS